MTIPLKIRAICAELGYCEGQRASCFFVHWTGKKPFDDARAALDNFIEQCKVQCIEPERELPTCCKAVLARNPQGQGLRDVRRAGQAPFAP